MIALPVGMSVRDWADSVALDLNQYGVIGSLDRDDQWQAWAANLCALAGISAQLPPDPFAFGDWVEWARRFVATIDRDD